MHESSPIRIVISAFRAFWLDVATGRMIPDVRGGEGPVDDATANNLEIPTSFEGLDDTALRDLHTRLEARFTAERPDAKTRNQIDTLRGYREAQARIATELGNRATEAAELAETLTGLDTAPDLPEPVVIGDDTDKDKEPVADTGTPAAPAETVIPDAIAAGLTAADVAAGRPAQTTTERAPVAARTRPRAAMTAAASQSVLPYNQEVSLEQIGQIVDGIKGNMKPVREVLKAHVASVAAYDDMPELAGQILSTANSTRHNDELIRDAVDAHMARRSERMGRAPKAVTAAICDPLDIIREIPDYVSQADPLSAAFPSRPISRLGFNFTPAVTLSAIAAGAQAGWDDTDQASVDPDDSSTWKPVYEAGCGSPCEVTATAATAGLLFDVTTEMSNPERIRDIMSKLTALRIRVRTNQLLGLIDALSLSFTRTGDYSLFPDTVYAINDLLTRLSYGERLDAEDYTLFVPPGFPDYLVNDIMGKEFQSSEEYAQGETSVMRRLSDVCGGIEVIELRDDPSSLYPALPAVATPTVLSDVPCSWPLRLVYTPGSIYGSTGLIDTGIVSDPQLARQNKRQWFQEEFTLLTKHGSPPWAKLVLTSAASGSRAAASTKLACA